MLALRLVSSSRSGVRHWSAFTWLSRGLTETVSPKTGRLKPNLHRLPESEWILVEEGIPGPGALRSFAEAREMLRRKHETFESPDREKYLLQMPGSSEAQAEVLEMLLEYLPRRYPNCFRVSHGSVKFGPDTVVTTSAHDWHAEYRVGDFAKCPIELASRLVCEDLVVLQDGVVCAGSVMFSFSNFHKRFGKDMNQLHAKVPQYGADLEKPVNRIFASLSPDRPLCRSNWNISWSDDIMAGYSRYPHRNPGISAREREASLTRLRQAVLTHGLADSAWLKVEYQTLRRLRQNSSCILFTIRTFLNSFADLSSEPSAAGNLLLNLQQLHGREFSQYLGIDDPGIYTLVEAFVKDASSPRHAD
ncbi:unnamed protein product [Symbiodinium necroappetens]|uniref:Uncharacterized protein n=1 Tax=Symbiodinium necroappetens TaxID=1628268 RepID=A0A812VRG5_9DINO|nr:unnamed protein product [Symbiodinium necroappetens]